MKVKIKKLNENAALPKRATSKDFCYDVVAVSEEEVAPNVWKYGLGFAFEIERTNWLGYWKAFNDFDISLDFRPRSSVWKTGMILSNCVGTLDEMYRGEVMAFFYHVCPNMPRYKVGDRIGQIKLGLTLPLEFEFSDEINMNTDRGIGGFGSTGK